MGPMMFGAISMGPQLFGADSMGLHVFEAMSSEAKTKKAQYHRGPDEQGGPTSSEPKWEIQYSITEYVAYIVNIPKLL